MSARSLIHWVVFGVSLCLVSGCASTSSESVLLHQKDQEIRALEEESSRRAGALENSQKVVESVRAELRALNAEKGRLSEELARRQTELEYHEEKARALQLSQRSLQEELTKSNTELLEVRRNVALASRRLEHVTESVQKTGDATRIPEWVLAEGVPEIRVPVKTLAAVNEELLGTNSALEPLAAILRKAAGDTRSLIDDDRALQQDVEVVEATTLTPLIPVSTSSGTERSRLGETDGSLVPSEDASRGGTFISQLVGIVRHHFLRLFESGRKWNAGDYGFLGVLLLAVVLLVAIVLVPFRWVLQRPQERELALLRRVVAAGAGGERDQTVYEPDEETQDTNQEAREPDSCTVIVESEDPEVEEPAEEEAAVPITADLDAQYDDEAIAVRPVGVAEVPRKEGRKTADDSLIQCGPPERHETDPVELASTQEMDRLVDDDLERTREFSRETEEGERTMVSRASREEMTAGPEDEFADEVAHALDAALPQREASPASGEAERAPARLTREEPTVRPESPQRRRVRGGTPPSAAPSSGETQGLEVPGPEDVAQTQEMPRLSRQDRTPASEGRSSVREYAQQTQGMRREVLEDGGATQPLERLAPEDADSTRELDPRAHEQFRTTQRVHRDSEEPSSTQEVRRKRLEEHRARSEERHDVEFRLTQEISVNPPKTRPVEAPRSMESPRETTRSPRPTQRPKPTPPRGGETAPLPGLITNEYATTQPLPELLFRSPEPKAPPPTKESRPVPSPSKDHHEEKEATTPPGEESSLLSQLERLMGRKIDRDRA